MSKFVYFNVHDGKVTVSVNDTEVGSASSVKDLVQLFRTNGVIYEDEFYHSSNIDYADEHGFDSADTAYELISEAIDLLENPV